MRPFLSLIVFAALPLLSLAQNLVTNPSFESYLNCNFSQGDADYATGWFKSPVFNQPPSHADYFNSCTNFFGVPNNPWGTEAAATGSGYVAITTKVPGWGQYRENIYSQLINPLSIGVTYSLTFKLSLCDNFQLASDKMGLKFSMFPNISISNSAHLFASSPVTQQNGWTVITGTFTADSAYTYIGVGNFFDDASTTEILTCPSCQQAFNIYYIDDISVVAQAPAPTPISHFNYTGGYCQGAVVHFTDSSNNNPNNWSWTVLPQSGATLSNPTAQNPNILFSLPGTYTVGLQASNNFGPGTVYYSSIQIYPNPLLTLSSSNNASVCAGASVQLGVGGANTYTWNNTMQSGNSITVFPQQNTYYSVLGANAFGCIGMDSILVVVRPNPNLSISSSQNIICYGTSTQLQASGAQSYLWNPGNTAVNPIQVSPLSTTVYTVTGTNLFGCSATSQHTIMVSECIGIDYLNGNKLESFFYPNPSQGKIVFNFTLPENSSVFIYDHLGQKVREFKAMEVKQNQLDLSELSKGIYFVKVESEYSSMSRRLIID